MGSPSDPIKLGKKTVRESWLKSYPQFLAERQNLSKTICEGVASQDFLQAASRIALFAGREHEVDLFPLFNLVNQPLFFPRVDVQSKKLFFYEVSSPQELSASPWGILEPSQAMNEALGWSETDLVFVPGFAFDAWGNRIGSGAGYYDRFFAENPLPRKWGICFQAQFHQAELAHTHHDVRMDAIVTEEGFYSPKKGK